MLAALFMGYIIVWALFSKGQGARRRQRAVVSRKTLRITTSDPGCFADRSGARVHLQWPRHGNRGRGLGVAGSLLLSAIERSLSWQTFKDGLVAACRVYCMIGLILAGHAFLTLAMGFMGLPRHLAEFIGGLNLSPFVLILMLTGFFIVLGCFLDGISMVVLTMAVLLPTVQRLVLT